MGTNLLQKHHFTAFSLQWEGQKGGVFTHYKKVPHYFRSTNQETQGDSKGIYNYTKGQNWFKFKGWFRGFFRVFPYHTGSLSFTGSQSFLLATFLALDTEDYKDFH